MDVLDEWSPAAHRPRPIAGGSGQREADAGLGAHPPPARPQHDRRPLAARRRHRRAQRAAPAQQVHVDEAAGRIRERLKLTDLKEQRSALGVAVLKTLHVYVYPGRARQKIPATWKEPFSRVCTLLHAF